MGQNSPEQAMDTDTNWTSHRLARTISAAGEAIYSWDIVSGDLDWSDGAAQALGMIDHDLPDVAAELNKRIAPDDLPARAIALSALFDNGEAYSCEFKIRRSDGGFEWVEEQGSVEPGQNGKPAQFNGLMRVVTPWKRREFDLEQMAYFDRLTGHLNRARLQETLDEVLAKCRDDGSSAAYLMVNIDRLSMLNDDYGFDIADSVIVDVGKRIEDCTGVDDIIGRAGGNQFGLILPGATEVELRKVAEQILSGTRQREVTTEAGPLAVSLSLGGTLMPKDATTSREIMGRTEEALSKAKQRGRDRFVLHRTSANRDATRRKSLATGDAVMRAMKDGRLTFAVQPIIDSVTGETQLYECLLRMLNEKGELIPAGLFIPVVEKLGLIRRLDVHTLEMALLEMEQVDHVNLAVNISGMTATDPSSLDRLLSLVHIHSGVADRLIFEITETVAMMDYEETARFANKLRDLGCRIALDDFGAGYTSYRHLKALSVDIVKIDGQFVQDLPSNKENQLFVQTLLDLAEGFNAEVVGECVETEAEAQALRDRGVKYLQGYHFGAPTLERPWDTSGLQAVQAEQTD
ncbi:MAG: EAL domain-containing protein [Rhodospirillaceae bacterium]|jgi:diguanylate cyclase (GGDEF)-like protein|nr:EAL domain-containing protein [Rhodospirillaceae bacterium]MBT6427247.1 EAL domain-containing protein [Rhodospirillaceae bacterium]MBT7666392.1 EAL domain-containing protein [Rhodospirillaceae bacterium]